MFVNFTNHPSGSWSAAQRRAAQVYGEILDLPFPDVPPTLSAAEVAALADEWAARILALRPACVLCQGEMTLTTRVVRLLQNAFREHTACPFARTSVFRPGFCLQKKGVRAGPRQKNAVPPSRFCAERRQKTTCVL